MALREWARARQVILGLPVTFDDLEHLDAVCACACTCVCVGGGGRRVFYAV